MSIELTCRTRAQLNKSADTSSLYINALGDEIDDDVGYYDVATRICTRCAQTLPRNIINV